MSFGTKFVLYSAFAAVLYGRALPQDAPPPAGPRADAGETPDAKGRTPSQIAADYERQGAVAVARQAREAQVLETRRQAVSVPTDTDDCLAYHRNERRCLVTVGELNRHLASDSRWVAAIGDTGNQAGQILQIRSRLLSELLEERYREALVDNPGPGGRSAEEAWRANLAAISDAAGEARLRALFREHAASFGPRREVRAEFLFASDSVFLDSLLDCMSDTSVRGKAWRPGPSGTRCASAPVFQWVKPPPSALPKEWDRTARNLRKGELSEVARCRFGWFVAAATQVTVIPGKSYEESRPLLAYMASLGPIPSGSVDSGNGKAEAGSVLPHANPVGRDAPSLRVWLLPRAASGKDKKPSSPAWTDTVLLGASRLRPSDLPKEVECEARALLRRNGRAFFNSRYGTWYFRAEKGLAAAPYGEGNPCRQEPPPSPSPDIVAMAAEALAGKEKEFKSRFLEPHPRPGEAADSGSGESLPPLARWIAENVERRY